MAACKHCGATLLFGGKRIGDLRYCSKRCADQDLPIRAADQVSEELVREESQRVRDGACPRCEGPGPVEVHRSYRVLSFVLVTSSTNQVHVCCRACGFRKQALDLVISLLGGWWGFPWGLLMTPVQVCRGLLALLKSDVAEEGEPSPELRDAVRARLALDLVQKPSEAFEEETVVMGGLPV